MTSSPTRRTFLLAAALATIATAAHADWPADGVVLCSACRARGVIIAPDGTGGAFVTWTDERNSTTGTNDDVFMQRVTASGAIAPGWPADGLPVSLAPLAQQTDGIHSIVPDGLGGVIVAWRDSRNAISDGTYSDTYAQRVLADGTLAPGWPVDGAPVARTPNSQFFPVVLADGYGGAFFTWQEGTVPDPDILVQHLGPDGGVMQGWPVNGLPVCTSAGFQGYPQLAPDGSGGVLVAWGDFDVVSTSSAQRVDAGGQIAPGWPENGIQMAPNFYHREFISDGVGGAFLAGGIPAGAFTDLYLQRFTGSGEIAAGWPSNGAPVCLAPDERYGLRMEPDGFGGVVMVWADYRDHSDPDVYALRMRADGTRSPGWPVNGLPITVNTALDDFPDIASDGQGGAYLTWVQYTTETGNLVMVQHLTGAGTVAPGWPQGGRVVPTVVGSPQPKIAADGVGGAIVTWDDYYEEARALRIGPDGPVPVAVSLASVEAEAGLVRLVWYAGGEAPLIAGVERRTESGEWEGLASITANGTGTLRYEDRTVISGTRYAYRLTYRDGVETLQTIETWITVPALRFALRGLTPNPSAGDPVVSFSLASDAPATLELFDLHGRLVLSHEAGAPGAGAHSVRLEGRGRLPAGVYTVRLRQGLSLATARAVIVR